MATEASHRRYALEATRGASYLATYRALVRKYPQKRPEDLLGDLVATTPGDEGNRFATAKEGGAQRAWKTIEALPKLKRRKGRPARQPAHA